MVQGSELTQTLSFSLDIDTGSDDDLQTGCLEARRIRSETKLNVRAVPGSSHGEEKIKIYERVFEWLTNAGQRPRILSGDLNSPATELPDGQAVPFGYDKDLAIRDRWISAELQLLKGVGHLGLQDAFRVHHGFGELDVLDRNWDRTKRFDHLFLSEALSPGACWYLEGGYEYSDHAPIMATFEA